jgi:hypothetical protein
MSTRATLIYKDLIVPKPLSHLYVKYVVAPEGKIPNNIVLVCIVKSGKSLVGDKEEKIIYVKRKRSTVI